MMALAKNSRLGFLFWGIRYDNILFFLGFPVIGALFTMPDFSSRSLERLVLFAFFNALFLASIFLFNDWGDAVNNPDEPQYRPRHGLKHPEFVSLRQTAIICAALSIASCAGIFILSALSGLMLAVNIGISVVYSHPRSALKKHPVLPELAHIILASLLFLSGWKLFGELTPSALLVALFFGVVLATSDIMNQVADFDREITVGLRTSAIVFGKRLAYRFSIWLFFLTAISLLAEALFGLVPAWIQGPAIFLIILWFISVILLARQDMPAKIRLVTGVIRIIYATFGAALIYEIIAHKF